jgi:hypothetical protein
MFRDGCKPANNTGAFSNESIFCGKKRGNIFGV